MSDPTIPPAPDTGGVTIGLKEIYDGLQEVKAGMLAVSPTIKTVFDHEQRLRAVERWLYGVPIALLGAAASVIMAVTQGGGH